VDTDSEAVEPGGNGSEPADGRAARKEKAPKDKKKGLAYRLYHGETAIDFIGRRNIGFIISAIVIGIGVISLATRGLNFGIDFKGGTSWEVKSKTLTPGEVRSNLNGFGLSDTKVEVLQGSEGRVV